MYPTRNALLSFSFISLISASAAQFVASHAGSLNLTVVRSPADSNVTVSYRQPQGICTTAFDSQRQYTGWVNVPGDYPTNLFFWFVEARQPTDLITIWLNGGPGSSSLYGFFTGNGPCEVFEKGLNEYQTAARDWGWDRASNMLFIDQPNQVGFSYDVPTNGTLNLVNETYADPPVPGMEDSQKSWQVLNGTFSSLNQSQTANTTELASMAVWHMIQGFFGTFPQYRFSTNRTVGINLFAESYGGRYGPVFAETFNNQNALRAQGALPRNSTFALQLQSLGIINGCVDTETQTPYYPLFASDNTYGFQAISSTEAELYEAQFSESGGCQDLLAQCLANADASDPSGGGNVSSVNSVCEDAVQACDQISQPYYNSGRSPYDMAAPYTSPFPPDTYLEYLNQGSIQAAVGSPINFTTTSGAVFSDFMDTGDMARGGDIQRLAALLANGTKIGLMYGDRDYICNWYGGEAVSKSIANAAGGSYASGFIQSGYAPIIVNDSYIGGAVRQFGNLSFSRIYQAGHSIASYQPETAFQVFARIIMGSSVSTGEPIDLGSYGSSGSANATQTDTLPPQPSPTCWIRDFGSTCDDDAYDLAVQGKGVVINGVLYSSSADWPLATEASTTTKEAASTPSVALTGVFTATETPESGAAALISELGGQWWAIGFVVVQCLFLAL